MILDWVSLYRGRRVLVTGHTGFKGAWLSLWLAELGARVTGYSLPAPTDPSLFEAARASRFLAHVEGDVRDLDHLRLVWRDAQPEIVFHLAAQSIVRESYRDPLTTVSTNVLGTTHVLELARETAAPVALVMVTSDKCYENREWPYSYRESDRLGGRDVYSGSKGAAEVIISSYRRSFFADPHGPAVASVRAGNVIGGGDWSPDRLVPDCVRALAAGRSIRVRQPRAVRPWQHVLEPLAGYLNVGARLLARRPGDRARAADAWNFGPAAADTCAVERLVELVVEAWGNGSWEAVPEVEGGHEASLLALSSDKARLVLGWSPQWALEGAVRRTVEWYRSYYSGTGTTDLAELCRAQIRDYQEASREPVAQPT